MAKKDGLLLSAARRDGKGKVIIEVDKLSDGAKTLIMFALLGEALGRMAYALDKIREEGRNEGKCLRKGKHRRPAR